MNISERFTFGLPMRIISDSKKALIALKWLQKEADRRLAVLKHAKVRNIAAYHEKMVDPIVALNRLVLS